MQLTIRVGAAVDRSLSEAFRPLVEAAGKAKVSIEKSEKARQNTQSKTEKSVTDDAEKWAKYRDKIRDRSATYAGKLAVKQAAEEMRAASKAAKAEAAEAEKLAKQRSQIRDRSAIYAGKVAAKQAADEIREEEKKTKAYERELAKQSRARERKTHQSSQEDRAKVQQQNKAAVGMAGRGLRAAGGFALGVAGDLARGAGVETSFSSIAQKNFDLQQQAADLSNAGFMNGDSRNGVRIDPNQLAAQTMSVGKATGNDANDVMEGLQKFVAKTGDLQSGRDVLEDMARLAKATGSNMSDVADAAGDVASALPEGADKARIVRDVMTGIAAQGKVGAVEIKQLATQMTKIAAASGQFEGKAQNNMLAFGAMAQMARSGKGGAASASQAANTIGAFTSTFAKGARLDSFEKFGVNVAGAGGKNRDPKQIILDSLKAANDTKFGGPANANRNMGEMFKDVNARRAMMGWENTYKEAGGGDAGLKAVSAKFDELASSTLSAQEAQESFAVAMRTNKSQAEVFNQAMRETTMQMQNELTPALIAMAPYVVEAAKSFASAIQWITGKSAITGELKDTGNRVVTAKENTAKALASGTISEGQLKANQNAENVARKTVMDAKAEADAKKADEYSPMAKGAAAAFDNSILGVGGRVFNKAFGSGDMNGIGNSMVQKKEQTTADAVSRMEASEQLLAQALEVNKSVADRLGKTLVVRIEGGASGPPGIDPAGRTPPP